MKTPKCKLATLLPLLSLFSALMLSGCGVDERSFSPTRTIPITQQLDIVSTPKPEATMSRNIGSSFAAESQTLNVVVPPCIPFPGSHIDPCERRDTWPRINPYVSVSYELIQPHPTLAE